MTYPLLLLAAVFGAIYAYSPLSVLVATATCLLFRYVSRDLEGRERRWVLGVLVTGFGLRALAVIGLFITTNPAREQVHTLFGDGRVSILRSIWMLNDWDGVPSGAVPGECAGQQRASHSG